MNKQQIAQFVENYMQATESKIIERSPRHLIVKLSPEADKALTNRNYYWSFVERTGAEPETMTLHFDFGDEQSHNETKVQRPHKEKITFGCSRLNQMFQAAQKNGKIVKMHEQPENTTVTRNQVSRPYTTWLCVNYRLSYICELKRDELHSLGISMSTGEIVSHFVKRIQHKNLSPKLPPHTHMKPVISLTRAVQELEKWLEQHVRQSDHIWAKQASQRLDDELAHIDFYYEQLLQSAKDDEEKHAIRSQHETRRTELIWQHSPRIQASVVNCGYFHLFADKLDDTR